MNHLRVINFSAEAPVRRGFFMILVRVDFLTFQLASPIAMDIVTKSRVECDDGYQHHRNRVSGR